jgi:hypothetical protein
LPPTLPVYVSPSVNKVGGVAMEQQVNILLARLMQFTRLGRGLKR